MPDNCRCSSPDPVECAEHRHVKAFDDITRAMQMEEADEFGPEDGCRCFCHADWKEYGECCHDYEEVPE